MRAIWAAVVHRTSTGVRFGPGTVMAPKAGQKEAAVNSALRSRWGEDSQAG